MGGQPKERDFEKDIWKPTILQPNFANVFGGGSRSHLI